MIRKILLPFGIFLLLAAGESAVARWMPPPFAVPLLLPALLVLAFRLPVRRLARLAVLGGLAGEVTSGLPTGTVLLALVMIPLAVHGLVRRPDLPLFLHGLAGAFATLVFLTVMHALVPGPLLPPQRLLGQFLTAELLFPSLFSGALVLLMNAFLLALEQRRLLPLMNVPTESVNSVRSAAR
ncbi:MAG: hypothetical protein Q8R32_02430 [bacterium]|nr:hypothetical protein [bacterium]